MVEKILTTSLLCCVTVSIVRSQFSADITSKLNYKFGAIFGEVVPLLLYVDSAAV